MYLYEHYFLLASIGRNPEKALAGSLGRIVSTDCDGVLIVPYVSYIWR
jgi:hypothetical protein